EGETEPALRGIRRGAGEIGALLRDLPERDRLGVRSDHENRRTERSQRLEAERGRREKEQHAREAIGAIRAANGDVGQRAQVTERARGSGELSARGEPRGGQGRRGRRGGAAGRQGDEREGERAPPQSGEATSAAEPWDGHRPWNAGPSPARRRASS